MGKKFDIKKLIDSNPKVDKKQLEEGLAALEELRQFGVQGAEYNLAPPFGGKLRKTAEKPSPELAKIRVRR